MDPIVYTYYERLSHNPEDAEALALLWDHHGTRGEFQQLATLAEQVAARRMDPRSGADLFYRAGELWAKNVGRPDKAVACYLKAAELDPAQQLAIGAARDIYVQLGNHRQAAQLLDRQIAATADPLVRGMLLREGMTLRAQAGDIAGQLAYLEEILAMSPNDWEMMREMAGALIARAQTDDAQPDDAPRAAQMLSALAQSMGPELGLPFAEAALDAFAGDETAFAMVSEAYTAAGRPDDLTVRQIAFVTANPGSEYAVGIRRALAEAYLVVGQVDDAINCLEPIVGVDPALQRTLAGLYRQAGRVDELASLFDQLAPTVEPAQRAIDLKELAALYGQQGNRAAMIRAMRDVLAIDPADPDALTLVEDDLRARREYGDLREVLAAAVRAPHCPPDARIPRLREIARLSTDHLKDADAAVDAWREILNSGPADVEALAELDPLLEHGERWDELVMVLEQRAELTDDPELRRTLLGRLADLHRDRRDDPVAEAAVVAMLWEAAPNDDGVAMRLAALRKITGDAAGAVEVLRARAERATGPEAAGRWAALAEAREQAEDLAGAIEAWREVVSRDNTHPRAWTEIERLLGATRQHAVLFASPAPAKSDGAVVCVTRLLDRVDQLETSDKRVESRTQDHAALALLARRGLTTEARRSLREQLAFAEGLADAHDEPATTEELSEEARALRYLYEARLVRGMVDHRAAGHHAPRPPHPAQAREAARARRRHGRDRRSRRRGRRDARDHGHQGRGQGEGAIPRAAHRQATGPYIARLHRQRGWRPVCNAHRHAERPRAPALRAPSRDPRTLELPHDRGLLHHVHVDRPRPAHAGMARRARPRFARSGCTSRAGIALRGGRGRLSLRWISKPTGSRHPSARGVRFAASRPPRGGFSRGRVCGRSPLSESNASARPLSLHRRRPCVFRARHTIDHRPMVAYATASQVGVPRAVRPRLMGRKLERFEVPYDGAAVGDRRNPP
jgi:tetratricopeptide (TPR) repeat protein